MRIDSKSHASILIGSVKKELVQAKRKGTYSVRDIYFLNCIAKTINLSCQIGMTEEQQRELSVFYFKFMANSNKFCSHKFESAYYKDDADPRSLFVQTNDELNNKPTVDGFLIESNPGVFSDEFNTVFE